jgi:hypothetical protein
VAHFQADPFLVPPCFFPLPLKGRKKQAGNGRKGKTMKLEEVNKRTKDCTPESSDMLLYLAGVNEHAVLRIVGSKRWSVEHFLRTIQYLFEHGVRFLAT